MPNNSDIYFHFLFLFGMALLRMSSAGISALRYLLFGSQEQT